MVILGCNYNGFMRAPKSAAPANKPQRQRSRDGLRPVRVWIPDLDAATFGAEAHRQSLAAANSPGEREAQDFIDAISDRDPAAE